VEWSHVKQPLAVSWTADGHIGRVTLDGEHLVSVEW
jgi:hypothetical protein